ncbi:hypothetical protein QIS74_13736 [Colletotrichum tabaci]|uniref:PD-(D/E)XK nuclease-like domain-containing protein n=1 Tax=Colletotrichum tabaci TaxID=1209068 RepID=A0AAV9SSU4_9PEZI
MAERIRRCCQKWQDGRGAFDTSEERDRLGPTPAIDDVLAITQEASHARPMKPYRHLSTSYPSTMVDFASVVRPRSVEDKRGPIVQAIDRLRRQLPGQSINHTDHYPFPFDPIVVCIETKRPGNGEQKQALQTGS